MHCLEDRIRHLRRLLLVPVGCVPPSLFLCGLPGTGKSAALQRVLQDFTGPRAVVSGVESYAPTLLFRLILAQLAGEEWKCDGVGSFVMGIQKIGNQHPGENVVIVVEGAERLRQLDAGGTLLALLRMQELTLKPVCMVLTSCLVWDKFLTPSGLPQPLVVHFPQHSRSQLLELLMEERPADAPEDLYRRYLSLLLSVFLPACRSLRELRYQARVNFSRYHAPVLSGEVPATDARRLWRAVEPQLKAALKTVYMREATSDQWNRLQQQLPVAMGTDETDDRRRLTTELPFYSKFLLIAAFLASYNPAKTDRRFFVKKTGKGSGRLKPKAAAAARTTALLTGPRPAPLDRLLAIFYAIVEDRVAPTACIYSQVSSLVTLRLLSRRGGADRLDAAKYTCLANMETVKAVAKTVQFELEKYLFDYV